MTTIGVAIPTIPPRAGFLARAVASVAAQERPADAIAVALDRRHQGAAVTRNRAWRMLDTDLVAFLDDDDQMESEHLAHLEACLVEHDADLVYPWFTVVGGGDPFPQHFRRPWNPEEPVQTTVTCLWRRSALEKIGGFPEKFAGDSDENGNRCGEDFIAVLNLNAEGGRIVHLPERTWIWNHHRGNTSGRPDCWA